VGGFVFIGVFLLPTASPAFAGELEEIRVSIKTKGLTGSPGKHRFPPFSGREEKDAGLIRPRFRAGEMLAFRTQDSPLRQAWTGGIREETL